MGIQAFPAVLQPIIQTGYLERAFHDSLKAQLAYRAVAMKDVFPARIGETFTRTRTGLRPAVTAPLSPSGNTNFDNGLSGSTPGVEQYTMTINQYGDTDDLNVATETVGIANQFVLKGRQLGEQAGRSMDQLAANALFNAYLSGNTRATAATTTSASLHVDDVRGFQTVLVNGVVTPVSGTNTLAVAIGASANTVTAVAVDGSNTSTAPGGVSGTLTLGTAVSATLNQAVVSGVAPSILRPSGRATTAALVAGDTLLMRTNLLQAVTNLRMNSVPAIGGAFNCYLDPQQLMGLFADPEFQILFRGQYGAREYRQGEVFELMGLRFIPNNMAPQQVIGGLAVRRAIVVGAEALIESDCTAAMRASEVGNPLAEVRFVDGVKFINRAPMDRLQQIVAMSWNWIGGFVAPTDTTANPNVLPTASNAVYKRAVVVESL